MKHARDDYNRIQDPLNLIPADEPVFLIRGQDAVGAYAVTNWAALARASGADLDIVEAALDQANRMAVYHTHKIPDMSMGDEHWALEQLQAGKVIRCTRGSPYVPTSTILLCRDNIVQLCRFNADNIGELYTVKGLSTPAEFLNSANTSRWTLHPQADDGTPISLAIEAAQVLHHHTTIKCGDIVLNNKRLYVVTVRLGISDGIPYVLCCAIETDVQHTIDFPQTALQVVGHIDDFERYINS